MTSETKTEGSVAEGASKPLAGALRWTLGDLTVTVLNDGYLQGSLDLVTGITKDEAGSLQAAGFRANDPRITLNAFLITGAGRKPLLIDTGMGKLGGDTLGRVPGHWLPPAFVPRRSARSSSLTCIPIMPVG